jgi:hypothetical protein
MKTELITSLLPEKIELDDFETDLFGNNISFDGNTNLKKPKTKLAWTKDHVTELQRCAADWRYFAENYYYILDLKQGMIHPILRDYQKEMISSFIDNRFTIILASRQCGKSTSFEIFLCWLILFHKNQRIGILANKAEQARDILRKVKEAYELLPKWMQQGVKVWNTGTVKLENGSMVIASSTSSDAIRGKSIGLLIVDERAFIPEGIWDRFISSVYPTISSSDESKVIYVSTPNGLNHFHMDWLDAEARKNEFNPIRVDWWQVPGRDQAWKEETISNIGQVRFNQEYGNSFLGSIATLIEPDIIKDLKHKKRAEDSPLYAKMNLKIQTCTHVYHEPIPGHVYAIGVDSAKMTEDNAGDALGMQVLDITAMPFKQVCTFYAKSGISYLQAPEVACTIGKYYNDAHMFIENNEIGQEVANMIHFDLEYENVYFEKGNLPGFRTTKKTKAIGCQNLKILVENHKLELNDHNTISQLSTFIRKKTSYAAEGRHQDDLVMSLVACLFFMIATGLDLTAVESSTLAAKIFTEQLIENEETKELPMWGFLPDSDYEEKPKADGDGFVW